MPLIFILVWPRIVFSILCAAPLAPFELWVAYLDGRYPPCSPFSVRI